MALIAFRGKVAHGVVTSDAGDDMNRMVQQFMNLKPVLRQYTAIKDCEALKARSLRANQTTGD